MDWTSQGLHESNPTERFGGLARDYARHRPSYPAQIIDAITQQAPRGAAAADIGAGTGIMSRLLAERGLAVTAVEPNADMRASAEPHEGITFVDATAEATTLPDASVDLIVVAQALHWFEPTAAATEFARIAKPNARLALVWNVRDEADPFTDGYQNILERYGDQNILQHSARDGGIPPMPAFEPMQRIDARHSQGMDLGGFLGRARSASYTPTEGPDHDACFRELHEHFDRFADAERRVEFRYQTVLYLGARG